MAEQARDRLAEIEFRLRKTVGALSRSRLPNDADERFLFGLVESQAQELAEAREDAASWKRMARQYESALSERGLL